MHSNIEQIIQSFIVVVMGRRMGNKILDDNGGTRSGGDRRQYTSNIHIPERRSGKNRRSGQDRRTAVLPRGKNAMERRAAFTQPRDRPACEEDPASPIDD